MTFGPIGQPCEEQCPPRDHRQKGTAMGVKTRRLAAIGIVTFAAIGAATGVAVADDQHGNKQAV